MNSSKVQKVIKEQSKQYIMRVQQFGSDFEDAVINFFTSRDKNFLLVETESSTTSVARIMEVLETLKEDPEHQQVLKKYLDPENQRFLRWEDLLEIVNPLERLPQLTYLLVLEFQSSSKEEEDDEELLKKIIESFKTAPCRKVIFISSQEGGVMNRFLQDLEMQELFKSDESNSKAMLSESLWESVSCGCVSDVEESLKNGVNVNSVYGSDGTTALHVAAKKGHKDVVLTLLRNGAYNMPDTWKRTPLSLAARFGHTEVVSLLVKNNIYINLKNKWGFSPLCSAALWGHSDVVRILLRHGAEINLRNNDDWTALYCAALRNNSDVVKVLLNYGACMNTKSNRGYTPLHIAARWGNYEVVKILVEAGAAVNSKNNWGETPLDFAIENNQSSIIALLSPINGTS